MNLGFQSWQDFMKQPANMALKESKGIHACKQKYIQEQNKRMWDDPIMLQEQNGDDFTYPGGSGGAGGSTPFLTGNSAEVSTFTWTDGVANGITGSSPGQGAAVWSITHNALATGTDFTANHSQIRKKILIGFVSQSNLLTHASLDTTGYDIVVTASIDAINNTLAATSSWGNIVADNVANQGATDTVLGFTNTIAPSSLITVATASGGTSFTITNSVKGSVTDATTDVGTGTGSIAATTIGTDTFTNNPAGEVPIIDSLVAPYSSMPYNTNP